MHNDPGMSAASELRGLLPESEIEALDALAAEMASPAGRRRLAAKAAEQAAAEKIARSLGRKLPAGQAMEAGDL
jgi:hypothetical protein